MQLNLVPARAGLQWIKQGWQLLYRQMFALCILFVLALLASALVGAVPLVGPIISPGVIPLTTLVMMVGAAEAMHQRTPTPRLLLVIFQGGRQRTLALLTIAMLYSLCSAMLLALSVLVDDGQFARVSLGLHPLNADMVSDPAFQRALWLTMLGWLPLTALFWHAPALVYWYGISAPKALFFSFIACLRNWRAFACHAMGWFLLLTGIGMALGLLIVGLGAMLGPNVLSAMMAVAIVPMLLVVLVAMLVATVFSFRDCFAPPAASASVAPAASA